MTNGYIIKDFVKYVSLSIVGMICISIYIIADTYFIAQAMGAYGLASLNIAISVFSIISGFGLMIGIGGATKYTIQKNKGDEANPIFTHSLLIGLIVSIIFIIIGAFFVEPLAMQLGANYDILNKTVVYMRTILLFSPVFMLNHILTAFIRNDGNPKLAMFGTLVGSFSNIMLDYIFLFPLSMGMFGAALASGLSFTLCVMVLLFHFITGKNKFCLCRCKIKIGKIMDVFKLGSSSLINELAFGISLIVFNLVIIGIEGNVGVATFGIVANIAIIAIFMFNGVAQGIQPLISKGYGSGNRDLIKLPLKYAIITVVALAVIFYAIVFINATAIVYAFNSEANPTLTQFATSGIKIYFIGLFFVGINIVVAAFFSAIDNPKLAVLVSLLRSCIIIIPMVIILSAVLGMNGVWLSFVFSELIVCVLAVFLLNIFNAQSATS